VWGALVGAAILTTLPELFRVFADYRNVVQGILLMLVIVYLPRGVADTMLGELRNRRLRRAALAHPAPDPNKPRIDSVTTTLKAGAHP
jgi:branched-chain amino acid transport system permease protein